MFFQRSIARRVAGAAGVDACAALVATAAVALVVACGAGEAASGVALLAPAGTLLCRRAVLAYLTFGQSLKARLKQAESRTYHV